MMTVIRRYKPGLVFRVHVKIEIQNMLPNKSGLRNILFHCQDHQNMIKSLYLQIGGILRHIHVVLSDVLCLSVRLLGDLTIDIPKIFESLPPVLSFVSDKSV